MTLASANRRMPGARGRQGHGRPADPPILRLGPGGDYVRDFYGEDLTGNEEPEDDARAGT